MKTLNNQQFTLAASLHRVVWLSRKINRGPVSGGLLLGALAVIPSAQATEGPGIERACLFFNKVVFHLTTDLTTSSGIVLKANDTREIIIQGRFNTPANTPFNVTQALLTALCGSDLNNCIHNRDNTKIDCVELSADCDDEVIRKLMAVAAPKQFVVRQVNWQMRQRDRCY